MSRNHPVMLDEVVGVAVPSRRAVEDSGLLHFHRLPDGLPAPATPTHTTMPCVLVNAIDAATETHLRT